MSADFSLNKLPSPRLPKDRYNLVSLDGAPPAPPYRQGDLKPPSPRFDLSSSWSPSSSSRDKESGSAFGFSVKKLADLHGVPVSSSLNFSSRKKESLAGSWMGTVEMVEDIFVGSYPLSKDSFWQHIMATSTRVGVQLSYEGIDYQVEEGELYLKNESSVRLKSRGERGGVSLRNYEIRDQSSKKIYTHLSMDWPDHSTPSKSVLNNLMEIYKSIIEDPLVGKPVAFVHCRAGVGRSGTFVYTRALESLRVFVDRGGALKLLGQLRYKRFIVESEEQVQLAIDSACDRNPLLKDACSESSMLPTTYLRSENDRGLPCRHGKQAFLADFTRFSIADERVDPQRRGSFSLYGTERGVFKCFSPKSTLAGWLDESSPSAFLESDNMVKTGYSCGAGEGYGAGVEVTGCSVGKAPSEYSEEARAIREDELSHSSMRKSDPPPFLDEGSIASTSPWIGPLEGGMPKLIRSRSPDMSHLVYKALLMQKGSLFSPDQSPWFFS